MDTILVCLYALMFIGTIWVPNLLLTDAYSIKTRVKQLEKLKDYEIILPRRLDGRHRRDVNTLSESGHIKEPSFTIQIGGEEFILDLFINDVLFSDGFLERSYSEFHIPVDTPPARTHHCYYQGEVRGYPSSRVALSTCNGLRGLIILNGTSYYIEPLLESDDKHLIYKSENAIRVKPFYTYEGDYSHPQHLEDDQRLEQRSGRDRRDVNSEVKYIELVLIADKREFDNLGSKSATVEKCKLIANIMDMNYRRQLRTRVALALVEVWNTGDKFTVSLNPSETLNLFQNWRRKDLVPRISHDNAQFVTGLNFDGSTVGMAGVNTMCSLEQSCGVSQDHGDHAGDVASTICHEMGHNLGLLHDTDKCNCESPQGCIMSASSGSNPPQNWSDCSVTKYSENLKTGLGACMFNYPKVIFDGPICQNGFLEKGEECDCGAPEVCDNPCCVAETCSLHENATCAIGECCQDCQLKKPGSSCREMMNECDLPEFCTGLDEECPSNVYRQNGVTCNQGNSAASCYNGKCVTYDEQCKYIWGTDAKMSHESCWQYNTFGNSFGNCGLDDIGNYIKCTKPNKFCGKLYCEGGAGFPLFGTSATAQKVLVKGNECKAAKIDQGQDLPDPGYVTTGSPCGDSMLCYNYQCVNSSMAGIVPCKDNCHGNGICNSNNNCHCDDKWHPPTCEFPGTGGSIDSGPSSNQQMVSGTKSHIALMIILLVLFIPAFVIGVVVAVWKRDYLKAKLEHIRGLLRSPKRPPPPKTTNQKRSVVPPKATAEGSALKQTNGHNMYRWPDEVDETPARPAPSRPPVKHWGANNTPSNNTPSVSVIQPWKSQPLKPVGQSSLNPSPKPTRPALPTNVPPSQRVALKPVGTKPTIPKRPVSSAGNNNWNNSEPSQNVGNKPSGSTTGVIQPQRSAPRPPQKK